MKYIRDPSTHPSKFHCLKFPQTPAFASITQLHPKGRDCMTSIIYAMRDLLSCWRCGVVVQCGIQYSTSFLSFSLPPAFFFVEARGHERKYRIVYICALTRRHFASKFLEKSHGSNTLTFFWIYIQPESFGPSNIILSLCKTSESLN